ncbi:hypothetical protein EV424DRAFT_1397806 [Suillus variegatus]|nr:hypothetical protein EV424DRAFT_1397806 [Suillus variegatus]
MGLLIPIVALYIAVDVFLWSRPSAISSEFLLQSNSVQADALVRSARNNNNPKHQVLHGFLPRRTHASDIYFHPRHML